jgi:multicomponent Na+:H+ antiporter subunit C
MLTAQLIYGLTGVALFALGLRATLMHGVLLRRVLSLNVMGAGVFLMLIAVAYRGRDLPPDPVPQALVLTGIVVAVSATALALVLGRRLALHDTGVAPENESTGAMQGFPPSPSLPHRGGGRHGARAATSSVAEAKAND